MLGNFSLITTHFGELTMEQVSNTNFMVYLTNSYCLLRKIRKFWLDGCQSNEMKVRIDTSVTIGLKLCTQVCSQVLGQGILERIGVHSKNFAIVQNKLATTLKQYILTITGNADILKEVLHKQINFIC